MASGSNVAPVIIKRKKVVVEDGHHGGAWKVAYADFVTAMMAFFMLMWLLNATTEKQRKGIADYFSPVAPISRMSSGSDDMFMGDSVFAADVLPQMGVGANSLHETDGDASGGDNKTDPEADAQTDAFSEVKEVLLALGGESLLEDEWLRHVVSEITDEGLVLEFHDTAEAALFENGAEATDLLRSIAYAVLEAAALLPNDMAVEAHVATVPVVQKTDPTWDLSSDRAFKLADVLQGFGLPSDRIRRVTAYGDREPVVDNLMAARNNRLVIIFLRH
ncbi:flagellar motor protein MotB [Marivita hallyeonensis]|uniref:Chemotaxis protein MotB n=1 Tax=Marivita hallyeonensis TaxID=996342 RepID=A0A1M5UPC6_9RHOB|nr:flagellar motor protein MotB [Marivita hallyeonensis]SHH64800.1 chemotaxis protein MotB [Marivita hallyeonensis]